MKKLLLCASAFALMLGSCSKDDTEVAPIDVQGKLAFSAVMTIGNDTRTGAVIEGGDLKYTWDLGDMVGATVYGQSEVVPFINKTTDEASKTANFYYSKEDKAYLGGEKVYLAYPYEKDNIVDADGNIEMTIPATQRYRAGSFAQMTAPAVAYVPKFEDGAEYTFDAVSSFVQVPVIGSGNVSKIEMQIKKGGSAMKIAGSANVDVDSETPALTVPAPADAWADKITLDFGKAGLDLSYSEKQYIVYVLPAGLELTKDNTVFEFTATFSDQTKSTATFTVPVDFTMPVNHMQGLGTVTFGMEDKVLVSTPAEFVKYVYEVNLGTSLADAEYVYDGAIKTAVLVNDINLKTLNLQDALAGCEDDHMVAALTKYQTDGLAVNSIATGAKIDGNGHTISNLTVNGNGIFADSNISLANVTLSNIKVNVPISTNPALFMGPVNMSTFKGVTVGGGCYLNVEDDATPAMIANAYKGTLPASDAVKITYPRVNDSQGAFVYYAAKLTLQEKINAEDADLKSYFGNARCFGEIVATEDVTISGVAPLTETDRSVEYILDAVSSTSPKSISVIDSRKTSYWTGGVASAAPANGTVETAEQLAYVVTNGGSKLTLANNIDLQGAEGKVWTVGAVTVSLDGASKTIKNVNIVADSKLNSGNGYYSLLGNTVTATNLNVSDVTIDVQSVAGHKAYIGGLGVKGSANSVVVNGLTIKVGENVVAGSASIGGLISTLSKSSEGNNASHISIDVKSTKFTAVAGMFGTVGSLKYIFSNNTVTYLDGTTAYPMVDTWTINDDAEVAECSNVAAIVKNVKFNPTEAGQIISLTYSECTEPFCDYLVNTKDYNIAVDINGKVRSLTPDENPFENEE